MVHAEGAVAFVEGGKNCVLYSQSQLEIRSSLTAGSNVGRTLKRTEDGFAPAATRLTPLTGAVNLLYQVSGQSTAGEP